MPLTAKGKKILKALIEEYGSKKGKEVFYAMKNSGKIRGVEGHTKKKKKKKKSY